MNKANSKQLPGHKPTIIRSTIVTYYDAKDKRFVARDVYFGLASPGDNLDEAINGAVSAVQGAMKLSIKSGKLSSYLERLGFEPSGANWILTTEKVELFRSELVRLAQDIITESLGRKPVRKPGQIFELGLRDYQYEISNFASAA